MYHHINGGGSAEKKRTEKVSIAKNLDSNRSSKETDGLSLFSSERRKSSFNKVGDTQRSIVSVIALKRAIAPA